MRRVGRRFVVFDGYDMIWGLGSHVRRCNVSRGQLKAFRRAFSLLLLVLLLLGIWRYALQAERVPGLGAELLTQLTFLIPLAGLVAVFLYFAKWLADHRRRGGE